MKRCLLLLLISFCSACAQQKFPKIDDNTLVPNMLVGTWVWATKDLKQPHPDAGLGRIYFTPADPKTNEGSYIRYSERNAKYRVSRYRIERVTNTPPSVTYTLLVYLDDGRINPVYGRFQFKGNGSGAYQSIDRRRDKFALTKKTADGFKLKLSSKIPEQLIGLSPGRHKELAPPQE